MRGRFSPSETETEHLRIHNFKNISWRCDKIAFLNAFVFDAEDVETFSKEVVSVSWFKGGVI